MKNFLKITSICIVTISPLFFSQSSLAAKALVCVPVDNGFDNGEAAFVARYIDQFVCTDKSGRKFIADTKQSGVGILGMDTDPKKWRALLFCPNVNSKKFNRNGGKLGILEAQAGLIYGASLGVAVNARGGTCFLAGGGGFYLAGMVTAGTINFKPLSNINQE